MQSMQSSSSRSAGLDSASIVVVAPIPPTAKEGEQGAAKDGTASSLHPDESKAKAAGTSNINEDTLIPDDDSDEAIAFSTGSTPALTEHERHRSKLLFQSTLADKALVSPSSHALSPLREFLKKKRYLDPASSSASDQAVSGNTGSSDSGRRNSALALAHNEEGILASLLLPSVRIKTSGSAHKDSSTAHPSEDRLYIASRNKVHRPRAQPPRKRTSSLEQPHTGQTQHRGVVHNSSTRRSSEIPFGSYHTSSDMSPLFNNHSSNGGAMAASPQRNLANTVHSRDYGYPSTKQQQHSNNSSIDQSYHSHYHSSPPPPPSLAGTSASASGGAGGIGSTSLSSPFGATGGKSGVNGTSPSVMSKNNSIRNGGAGGSKASQMLGLSPSQTQELAYYSSSTANGSSSNSNSIFRSERSLTSSMTTGGSGTATKESSGRMTLKKARSLFTSGSSSSNSGGGGSKSKNNANNSTSSSLPSPPLPSSSTSTILPMGMGSYGGGDKMGMYSSPPSSGSVLGSNRYESQSMLSHSKSHGSLLHHGNGSVYDVSSNAPLFPPEGFSSYHPYAASSHRGGGPPAHLKQATPRSVSLPHHVSSLSPREAEQDVDCPVCLESLSIRLPGEKPHVVPVCGHKLHNECFETAYNTTVAQCIKENEVGLMGGIRKKRQPIGICGICRSEMKVGDPGETGKNKFAMLSGQPGHSPGLPALDTHKIHSISKRTIGPDEDENAPVSASLHDPSEDQDVLNPHQLLPAYMQHLALGPARSSPFASVDRVMPKITVRAEHTSLARVKDPEKKVHLTCLVTVEMPSRVPGFDAHMQSQANVGMQSSNSQRSFNQQLHSAHNSQSTILGFSQQNGRERMPSNPGTSITAGSSSNDNQMHNPEVLRRESNATTHTHGTEDFPTSPSVSTFSGHGQLGRNSNQGHAAPASSSAAMEKTMSGQTISSTGHGSSQTPATTACAAFTPHSTSASSFNEQDEPAPQKSHSQTGGAYSSAAMNMSSITLTAAAQEEKTREAHGPFADVFKDLQDRMLDWKGHEPSTFGSLRMHDTLSVKKDKNVREFVVYLFEEALLCVVDDRRKGNAQSEEQSHLRLKGRVFVKHMKQVEDTSSMSTGLSLTIHMEDDSLENFVILFPHRESLEVWRSQIQALIDHHRPPIPNSTTKSSMTTSGSRRDSVFSNETSRSAQSSFSRNTKATTATSVSNHGSGPVPSGAIPPVPTLNRSMQPVSTPLLDWTPPDPATFVPIDLMLVLSVPRANASHGPSSSGLKLRLIRSTLDFIIHSVGPRARIAIVAYSTGDSSTSSLRKTPWLATGRADGLRRLEAAVAELAGEVTDNKRNGALTSVDSKEERVTVATAVNLALDIMLQRASKSTTSGMIVLNDGKDGAQKQQIDLVMARTDAGGVPIHTFGWGKSHDPSSLWLLSNHTKGTYTFVRDFYQLREGMAGCIGGMLCVAVQSLRLHLNVQERKWFKIRKVAGVASAIVSSDGKDVDISLGELRFGEKKEMLVEIEMASPKISASPRNSGIHARIDSMEQTLSRKKSMTATDDFFIKKLGVNPLALGDEELATSDLYDEIEDSMADDVPVFDVNASFKNPQDPSGEVCRLPYPTLLTITVTPPVKNSNNPPDSPASASTTGTVSDPAIVRRRMELLTSDMITRTLLLMSRKQDSSAQRLLVETTRIFTAIIANLIPPNMSESTISAETRYANDVLQACLEDIEQLKKGTLDRAEFDTATRNFGAQQAVALRDQRAWTARTSTEGLFFCREWTAIFGRALST